MPNEHDVLAEIADSIADWTPVDWDDVESASDDLGGKLCWLRVVEAISQAHRDPPDETARLEPASAPEERGSGWRFGPLEVLEPLGSGSEGAVYRARDTRLGSVVALKLLKVERSTPAAVERFLDEARRLASVRHPNVVVVHGADRHDGRPGMWTDLLEGQTLEECLKTQGSYCAEEATRIGIDLCRALAAVHGAGLVHRDVKTSNVMRERGGRIVLLDFSSVSERTNGGGKTPAAGLSGTPLFMAPELFDGAEADERCDIYSLGVLLYRLVTGSYPVEASSFDELLARHARGETRPLLDVRADLPPAFVRVVERALARDPARRWASPGEMERALSTLVTPQPSPLPALGSDIDEKDQSSTRVLAWSNLALAAAAAVALAAFAAWLIIPKPLEVDPQWFRWTERREEPLPLGARVAPGDALSLEIKPSRAAHVWVLTEDTLGNPVIAFPSEGMDQKNPLRAARRHRLPGTIDGQAWSWYVGSAGGTETFLVVASTHPLPEFERRIEPLPRLGPRPEASRLRRTRGIDGIVPDPAAQGATSLAALDAWLDSEYGPEYGKGIHVSRFRFDNTEP